MRTQHAAIVSSGLPRRHIQDGHNLPPPAMKKLCIAIAFLASSLGAQDVARWEKQAANVTITRDDWGIAHVRGKTDADAVFGMIYAQAEDDFNRVETNFINAMGRLSEAEGSSQVWRDRSEEHTSELQSRL